MKTMTYTVETQEPAPGRQHRSVLVVAHGRIGGFGFVSPRWSGNLCGMKRARFATVAQARGMARALLPGVPLLIISIPARERV